MSAKTGSHQPPQMFKDFCIMILPTHIGPKRITLFETQIVKAGGIVCSPGQVKTGHLTPTHVVVEDSLLQNPTNLEKHLKTFKGKGTVVGTRWLSDSIKHQRSMPSKDYQPQEKLSDSAFSSVRDCSPPKKAKLSTDSAKKNELMNAKSSTSSESLDVNMFACSQSSSSTNLAEEGNQLVIQELQKLADAFRSKGDTWRSHGYTKAISAIKRCGKILNSYEDAVSLPGVGDGIASKVWEILETGSLRKVAEICNDEKTQTLELFTNIWGVGPSTAESWYQQGCRSLNDLQEKVSLTKQQQIGLKYYDDFKVRIPRDEVEEVGKIVSAAAKLIDTSLSITLVGSYRRGKDSCGDIDVMITRPDKLNSKNILSMLLSSLKESGLITDDLVSMEKERNQRKYLGVCCLPGDDKKHRRLDIFVVPKSESATALMHYTGSALFNRSIRLLAAKKGMSLSEHSMHGGVVREGLKALNDGYVLPTPSEESIFKALGLNYRPPQERDH